MNNIYSVAGIGKRIKTERTNLKLSQQDLADKLCLSARQTIAKWENGSVIPQLEDMLNMCNLFGCELGYLLGEHDCRTRAATDIAKETGLAEKSIENLRMLLAKSKEKPTDAFDTEVALADIILHTVNHLLSYDDRNIYYSLIGQISQYLYGDFTHFYTDDISDSEDLYYNIDELGLWDAKHGIENSFNMYKLMDVLLLEIQQHLKEDREHLQFDCEPIQRLTPQTSKPHISRAEYMSELEEELEFLRNAPDELDDILD